MKLVNLKCPNCDGTLTKTDDSLHCEACGAVFAIDYDESDVEIERLRMEAEQRKTAPASTSAAGNNARKTRLIMLVIALFVIAIPFCFVGLIMFQKNMVDRSNSYVVGD